ncbi:MAG: TerB N-terminal domain-containing protein [Eubacterium sp.]|nr:TerB N-terminal domain-containing protein [Eubacterium sp.]
MSHMEQFPEDNRTDRTRGYEVILSSPYIMTGKEYYDRFRTGHDKSENTGQSYAAYSGVPEKIRDMLALFDYGDRSFEQKCKVFFRQGMFMKDYEDSALWYGDLRSFFPVYHDLNIRQLRGYFAWRTQIRAGHFSRTCEAFVYIYVYELLNGIGADSAEDSFSRLERFYKGYVETGMAEPMIRKNLRRWMFEFAVTHDLPEEAAALYSDPGLEAREHAVAVLHDPGNYSDEEVFSAIVRFSSPRTGSSPVISKDPKRGKRLFAEVWQHLPDSVFPRCFGEIKTMPWHPLAGAVYWEQRTVRSLDYEISECRKYTCRDGIWQETGYDRLSFDQNAFLEICHMIDLKLRKLLKTGHYLRKKQGKDWAEAAVDKALDDIRREKAEASRPKISIDISGLDKIREDAGSTMESLLTEDEKEGSGTCEHDLTISSDEMISSEHDRDARTQRVSEEPAQENICGLDALQTAVLRDLIAGKSAETLISENHLMPEVLADSINEALIDEIGDTVIECTGAGLTVVEDYIDDLRALTGEKDNE